jgi:hypothetical protein
MRHRPLWFCRTSPSFCSMHDLSMGLLTLQVVGPCLRGEKRIALAVSEATAGSDVANLKSTAVEQEVTPPPLPACLPAASVCFLSCGGLVRRTAPTS